jgi:hypothetical protein
MSGVGTAARTAAELQEEMETAEKAPEETAAELNEPRLKEEWAFDFHHVDRVGREWKGSFKNQILSIDEINQVGVWRARLCGNVPIDALDAATLDNAERLAHLTVSLKKRPDWAADLGKLKDPEILKKLYQEVSSHEDIFHGRGQDPAVGDGGPGDATG